MKKLLIILINCVGIMHAGPQEELFLQAAKLYKAEKYQDALDIYQALEPKQPSVWYNMGNCAFASGDFVQAYRWWKKSERSADSALQRNIDKNIKVCLSKLNKDCHQSGLAAFLYPVYTMLAKIPRGILQLIFLLAWYGLLIAWVAGILSSRIIRSFWGMLIIGIAALLVLKYNAERYQHGIIITEQAPLFAGPDERYHVIGSIDYLDTIRVHQQAGDWCKVGNGTCTGWIQANAIEIS